jgi:hypothetical protein
MRAIRKILAVVVGLIAAVFAFLSVNVLPIGLHRDSELSMIIHIILCVAVPIIVFYFTARIIGWRVNILNGLRCLPRWLLVIIVIAYTLTWVFGVPAVQTATNADAVEKYKHEKEYRSQRVWDTHPWIRTSAAFPIFPGLVLSYHEYQVAGLYGWGGWELHVWYLTGVKSIVGLTVWIS